ncbi:MAG: hypothetical protein KAI39_09965 [Desulfobulbaceae bacterium]|nr:hypothetical protein [Desulfobulbaceae bacterium]
MAYDNPDTVGYNFALMDFGAASGDTLHYISGPAGKKGMLRSISIAATEIFACDATNADVKVGTVADPDAYGMLVIADATASGAVFNEGDDTDAIISAAIPADTVVMVTLNEGTDGTAVTGQGTPHVIIDWY